MKLATTLLLIGTLSVSAADPSLKAHPDPTGTAKYTERYRLIVDLNGDGADDMLLSGGPEEFGTMGGPWTVYLNENSEFKAIGSLWAHPLAIAFEEDQARIYNAPKTHRLTRVWVYLKSSGSSGSFGYYRIGKDTVDEITALEIYPGGGGTSLGNLIYNATFKHSPISFRLQRSTTTNDGSILWNAIER